MYGEARACLPSLVTLNHSDLSVVLTSSRWITSAVETRKQISSIAFLSNREEFLFSDLPVASDSGTPPTQMTKLGLKAKSM